MNRKGRKKKEESQGGSSAWMNTYGDLVTLLLTFFVLLFAFSNVDKQKFAALIESFSGQPATVMMDPIDPVNPVQGFTKEDYVEGVSIADETDMEEAAPNQGEQSGGDTREASDYDYKVEAYFSDLFERIQAYIHENGLEDSLVAERDGEYIYLTVIEGTLFESGQAELIGTAQTILKDIGDMLHSSLDGILNITVEGHTDNVPISNAQYVDNWDLSTKRATNVVRYLNAQCDLSMPMFTAVGKGEWEPVQPNDTEEGRRQNRRVKFVIASKNLYSRGGT
jgi:chemotaxis protein MotB